MSLTLVGGFFTMESPGKPLFYYISFKPPVFFLLLREKLYFLIFHSFLLTWILLLILC